MILWCHEKRENEWGKIMRNEQQSRERAKEPFCHLCMKSFHMCFSVVNSFPFSSDFPLQTELWRVFTKCKKYKFLAPCRKERNVQWPVNVVKIEEKKRRSTEELGVI